MTLNKKCDFCGSDIPIKNIKKVDMHNYVVIANKESKVTRHDACDDCINGIKRKLSK